MYLSSLLVRNFRMIRETSLPLQPGIHLFLGLNAQGKTSLIEAILFLSTSTSHRTHREEELIRWGDDTAYLRGDLQNSSEQAVIECGLEKKRKVIKIDGNPLPRVGDLYGRMRSVLFAPEDLQIVSGSPQDRRRFLDMAIAQLDPDYIPILQYFRRALQQRNQILKRLQMNGSGDAGRELAVWDLPFLQYGSQVIRRRLDAIRELAPLVEDYYAGLAGDAPLRLAYEGWAEVGVDDILPLLQQKLERSRRAEIERGSAQIGPHRDDLFLYLGDRLVSQFGSQGQRRAVSLALRLAEARHCFLKVGQHPILLIDDVVYEMDNPRRSRFWRLVDTQGQLIVTATDREHLGQSLDPAQVFRVDGGEIERA